jgi:Uma2 family endonuclease
MTARRALDYPFRFSREQYYRLGELGFFDGKRVERIRGEILEMSPIGWPHVVACRKTAVLLERIFNSIAWVSRNDQPLELSDSDPQPDVMVVAGRFEDYHAHPTTALLVVEVADATLDRDLTTKAELYATANIPEYWIIDLENRRVVVLRDPQPIIDNGNAYRTQRIYTLGDQFAPLAVPHALIAVSDLLP